MIYEEIQKYRDLNGLGIEEVDKHLKVLIEDFDGNTDFPVCVLSHKFDKRRSKFLVNLKNELDKGKLYHNYYIFTYADQKDLYEQFEDEANGVHVCYIPLDRPEYLTLTGKRQYILEWNQKHGHENAFFIEDDCTNFCLPVGSISDKGSFKNKQFIMSYNFTFSLWESIIKDQKLSYSGPATNMAFAFRDLRENPFVIPYGQAIQAVHINTYDCAKKMIRFDEESGWDDYDMLIQQAIYNKGSTVLSFSYSTPSLKSGVSAMSATADALEKRCAVNTTKLIDKWGLAFVREDTKKGLYNAKVNWYNIKAGIKAGTDLVKLIGKSNEEAKKIIKITEEPIDVNGGSSLKDFM